MAQTVTGIWQDCAPKRVLQGSQQPCEEPASANWFSESSTSMETTALVLPASYQTFKTKIHLLNKTEQCASFSHLKVQA